MFLSHVDSVPQTGSPLVLLSDIVPVGIIAGGTVGSFILLLLVLLALAFFLYRQRKGSECVCVCVHQSLTLSFCLSRTERVLSFKSDAFTFI